MAVVSIHIATVKILEQEEEVGGVSNPTQYISNQENKESKRAIEKTEGVAS